jgi:hypothetical protein
MPPGRSRSDPLPYILGGVVSAAVILLVVLIWIVAVPDNPFTGTRTVQNVPIVNNGTNPNDVPTVPEIIGVGTSVPPVVPSVPQAVPTGSPGPAGGAYLPHSLGVFPAGGIAGHGPEVSSYLLRHLLAAGE